MPKSAESPASTAGEVRARGAESTSAPVPESRIRQPTRSIGQVMAILRTEFPGDLDFQDQISGSRGSYQSAASTIGISPIHRK
jgi:hypothetical protein